MATSEEIDKQVSATNDGKRMRQSVVEVNPLNRIYKSEHVLSDGTSSMATKVRALIDTWNELAILKPQPTKESLHTLAKFLLSHTLNIVLSVKWMKYKNDYHSQLEQGIKESMKTYATFPEFQIVCTKLLSLIKGPWAKNQIREMLTMESIIPSKIEYNFFVYEESAYIISMRLKKLCEDKCGDMALNLTRCYLKCCDWAETEELSMYISENQKKFVFDIYLSLLYQHDGTIEMSNLLKTMEISDGVDMVRRFAGKISSKLWENNISIAKLSGTIFLTRCSMKPLYESMHNLEELLAIWTSIFIGDKDSCDELIASLRRIMKNAHTAAHMYLFVDHLSSRFGLKMRPYCVEVCIQAINTDLNLLERIKSERPENSLRSDEFSMRIADGFMRLALQFTDNLHVARECVLTSFSIHPSAGGFLKIEEMARASGYQVLDTGQWKCKLHAPADPAEELLIQCDACKDYVSELKINPALKQANTALIEAFKVNNMGLPSVLCDDLVVIIFCVRYQMLSWQQRWSDLQRLCVMYLNDPVGTKNLITELKFVEIDYTPYMIKREVEEWEGNEEAVIDMEIEEFEAIHHKKKRRRVIYSSDEDEEEEEEEDEVKIKVEATAAAETGVPEIDKKSDPNVLRALKSFRRSIKRPVLPKQEPDGTVAEAEYVIDWASSCAPNPPSVVREETVESSLSGTNYSINGNEVQICATKNSKAVATYPQEVNISINGNGQSVADENEAKNWMDKPQDEENISINGNDVVTGSKNSMGGDVQNDPQKEKHRQEFGNFRHDAENYEIDRELSEIRWDKKAPDAHEHLPSSPKVITDEIPWANEVEISDDRDGDNEEMRLGKESSRLASSAAVIADEIRCDEEKHFVSISESPTNAEDELVWNWEGSTSTSPTSTVINGCEKTEMEDADEGRRTQRSSQNLLDFFKRVYNIKECSIVLTRCDRKENTDYDGCKKFVLRRRREEKFRKVKIKICVDNNRSKVKSKRKSSENVVQSHLVKYYNINLKYPLQINNRRILSTNNNVEKLEALKKRLLKPNKMNPVVVLKRLEDSAVQSLLARVPGVSDTHLFRPINTNQIVNVVQVAGGRSTSTVQSPNTQTSTQVSPHIQRIGQPRNEKSDANANQETVVTTKPTNTYTISKPAATQSSTLINIFSQQIRPTNSNNRSRSGPLINIISHPTIKATNTTVTTKTATTVTSEPTTGQVNATTRIIATSSEQQQQIINQIVNTTNRGGGTVKAVVGTSNSEPGRIVQFICKSTDGKLIPVTSFPSNRLLKVGTTNPVVTHAAASDTHTSNNDDSSSSSSSFAKLKKTDADTSADTLPKFQQAFGKSNAYQSKNNVDSTNTTNVTNNVEVCNNITTTIDKNKTQLTQIQTKCITATTMTTTTTTTLNVQPIQGGVIYTRQMPVGQTINLIQQNRGQVFRIATTNAETISLVKDSAIHSKMSVLLAAALQGKPKSESTSSGGTDDNPVETRVIARPSLVQNARIVKPVLQIPSNVIRSTTTATPQNLSSTTLEQLREFDMVYKQVKERSSTSTPADTSAPSSEPETSPQRISVTYLNQSQKFNCAPVVVVSSYNSLQPAASPALSVASQGSSSPCVTPAPATPTPVLPKVASKNSKGKSVKNPPIGGTHHASKTSPIPKPQQKPQEDEHTTQRIFDILAEYAEQLRNSPDLNNKPAPRRRSNPPTNPSQNSKRKKGSSSSKKTGQCSLSTDGDIDDPRTIGSEDSSCGIVQLSLADDEQTPTTASTSESNDSTNHVAPPRQQQLILTDSTSHNQTRNLIIADSSSVGEALKMPNTAVLVPGNYIMPVSMVKGGQQIAVVSGGSKILATVPARSGPNMLLFQSFLNQNRKTTATNLSSVKYSTIQPISGITSHSLTGVSAQPPVILPPPTHGTIGTVTLGQPIAIKKLDDAVASGETRGVNTEQLLLTISQSREPNCELQPTRVDDNNTAPQPDSSTSVGGITKKLDREESTAMPSSDHSAEKIAATPIATPVIAQTNKDEHDIEKQSIMTIDIHPPFTKVETPVNKSERVQSVLVTAGTSNGPMLSHSPPQYKQSDCSNGNEQTKNEFLRNGGKRNDKVQSTVFCVQGKIKKGTGRMDREVQQMCMQRRQAAIERELRLQKSLSEECEDLGVDEPSTSDLFPEALLFDANNSPSFDQSSQDVKRSQLVENKLSLFSDDDDDDFIFEASQYDNEANDHQLCYEEVVDSRILSNGQGRGADTGTDNYHANTPPPLNKYMHKYTNKKKTNDKAKVDTSWSGEVSSSEDTTGSTELPSSGRHGSDEEDLSDGSFKVVRIALGKNVECNDLHCSSSADEDCSASGRGARRAIKKTCSCCNGAEDALNLNVHANTNANATGLTHSRKRPATSIQQQHTSPHKKAFPNKKR